MVLFCCRYSHKLVQAIGEWEKKKKKDRLKALKKPYNKLLGCYTTITKCSVIKKLSKSLFHSIGTGAVSTVSVRKARCGCFGGLCNVGVTYPVVFWGLEHYFKVEKFTYDMFSNFKL